MSNLTNIFNITPLKAILVALFLIWLAWVAKLLLPNPPQDAVVAASLGISIILSFYVAISSWRSGAKRKGKPKKEN